MATEVGILHRLRRAYPEKRFEAADDRASCQYMKLTTLPKLLDSLEKMQHRITVPEEIAAKALLSIERMVSIGAKPRSLATPGAPASMIGE